MTEPIKMISIPRSLFIFALLYGGLVVLAGVLGTKLAEIGPLHVESGIFAFLQLVVISSAVAEVHGKSVADRLVRFGFLPLILSMVMITIIIQIPHAPFWSQQEAFASLLGQGARMQLAGLISYGTSQTLNVYVFSKMKEGNGSAVWLRGLVAALLSQTVDTILFITISFYAVKDPGTQALMPIWDIMTGQIIAKLALVTLAVPILISLLVRFMRYLDRENS